MEQRKRRAWSMHKPSKRLHADMPLLLHPGRTGCFLATFCAFTGSRCTVEHFSGKKIDFLCLCSCSLFLPWQSKPWGLDIPSGNPTAVRKLVIGKGVSLRLGPGAKLQVQRTSRCNGESIWSLSTLACQGVLFQDMWNEPGPCSVRTRSALERKTWFGTTPIICHHRPSREFKSFHICLKTISCLNSELCNEHFKNYICALPALFIPQVLITVDFGWGTLHDYTVRIAYRVTGYNDIPGIMIGLTKIKIKTSKMHSKYHYIQCISAVVIYRI